MTDPLAIAFAGLLGVSFAVSAADAALFGFDDAERRRLASDPLRRAFAERLQRLQGDGTGTRSAEITLLVIDTVATVFATAIGVDLLAEPVAALAQTIGAPWLSSHTWPAALALTPVVALFPRITARALAARLRQGWGPMLAGPVIVAHVLLGPIRVAIEALTIRVARALGAEARDEEAEILRLLDRGTASGSVRERERDIVEAVFDFGEMVVGRLMTPRPDMFAVQLEMPWMELVSRCQEAGFSRIPVYQRKSDEIIGVLLLKDLLRYRAAHAGPPGPTQLRALLLPPSFVPQSKSAKDMLRELLDGQRHMAFVVDEHGTLVGLITLDDLLARLVGEHMDDESSEEASLSRSGGVVRVKAWMDVDDFIEQTGIDVPREGGWNTVGGFVFHELGRLPHRGDSVLHDRYKFTIASMEGRRIGEIEVRAVNGEPR